MDEVALNSAKHTVGDNGSASYTAEGVDDALLALSFKLVRGLSDGDLRQMVRNVVAAARRSGADQATRLVDTFVLAFQTRDIREGKGERRLFYVMLVELFREFPQTTLELLKLVPDYGSWLDVCQIAALADTSDGAAGVSAALVQLMSQALLADAALPDGGSLSLVGKWAPRECNKNKPLARRVAEACFPGDREKSKKYRQLISALNKRLRTVEVDMAAHKWSAIRPGAIPAKCLKVHREALLNKRKGDVRHPEDDDRVQCAKNMVEHLEEAVRNPKRARVHGAVLHPHEIVRHFMRHSGEDSVLEAQWVDLRMKHTAADDGEAPALAKMVPLVDVSGSMSGQPMEVAIALGILMSEVNHPSFRDRLITFSSTPAWHVLQSDASLADKVRSTRGADWNMSTDFAAAMELILRRCVEGRVPASEVEGLTLVVLSDMQFDAARGGGGWYGGGAPVGAWEPHHEKMRAAFAAAGYAMPRIVFWNLRGDTRDFVAAADTPGVDMLSGFSPNLLKLFMAGDWQAAAPEAEKPAVTPLETLRKCLDAPEYDAVRRVCAAVGEAGMAGYVAPEREAEAEAGVVNGDEFVLVEA